MIGCVIYLKKENMKTKKRINQYCVEYGGKLIGINPTMADRQKLSKRACTNLIRLHCQMEDLFERIDSKPEGANLKKFVKQIENIEFEMQKEWKFTQDAKFHVWWNRVSKCTCPRLDNADRWGTGQRVISSNCPLHGKRIKKKK